MTDLVIGADGLARCAWGASTADYLPYHDTEWGQPVRGDDRMFERMVLEAFQSGLSWITILRKRPAFRAAFAEFSIPAVADFDEADVERLLQDVGIVRNRAKIEAAIRNARACLEVPGGCPTCSGPSLRPRGRIGPNRLPRCRQSRQSRRRWPRRSRSGGLPSWDRRPRMP